MDLNSLSLAELKKLRKDVEKAIDSFEDRARKKALAEADAVVRQHGFTIDQLLGKIPNSQRGPLPAKYANPDNPKQTWSGRGRRPRWVLDALQSGKTLEDLAV